MADQFQRRSLQDRSSLLELEKTNSTGNATADLILELVLEDSVQSRINVIVTAAFNIAAALAITLSVVYDAHRLWKKSHNGFDAAYVQPLWLGR